MMKLLKWAAAGAAVTATSAASAGTPPYFVPLTESAPVTAPMSNEEVNAPWVAPAGMRQENLTSMSEIEGDPQQSTVRAPGAAESASMWDMAAFDPSGRFVFVPHETPWGAGLSRYDRLKDESEKLWSGDGQGVSNNWSKDFAAFDPATFTPNCSVFVAEEWSGLGRLVETTNPFAPAAKVRTRVLDSIAKVAHEGLQFSRDEKTLYFIDEWNSGSIYKFVMATKGDYTKGQTFVLKVDGYAGNAADNYNEPSNVSQPRTGAATWIPITNENGVPLTTVNPFRDGATNDPRTSTDTRGGRPAADEVGATPYGRPEDMEISRLANGNEVVYFTATSENSVYSIELVSATKANVRLFAGPTTPKNVGFAATTGAMNSPDNLAKDALGNIYIVEDAPNSSTTGGDVWFARDVDNDGVAESIDHFLSLRVAGSESTGMIFSPTNPFEFVVHIQHPTSTDLDRVPRGFGDAMWLFDIKGVQAPCASGKKCPRINPVMPRLGAAGIRDIWQNARFIARCAAAAAIQMRH